jgi:predicted ATP-binding protein involved in virulence
MASRNMNEQPSRFSYYKLSKIAENKSRKALKTPDSTHVAYDEKFFSVAGRFKGKSLFKEVLQKGDRT